jgi:GGDEF domain-containing protein
MAASRLLAASLQEFGIVGHYAPGCFALLLSTAGLADAIRVAERLRHRNHQTCQADRFGWLLTVKARGGRENESSR